MIINKSYNTQFKNQSKSKQEHNTQYVIKLEKQFENYTA